MSIGLLLLPRHCISHQTPKVQTLLGLLPRHCVSHQTFAASLTELNHMVSCMHTASLLGLLSTQCISHQSHAAASIELNHMVV